MSSDGQRKRKVHPLARGTRKFMQNKPELSRAVAFVRARYDIAAVDFNSLDLKFADLQRAVDELLESEEDATEAPDVVDIFTSLLHLLFVGHFADDALLAKFGRSLAHRLRILGFNAKGGRQRQRLAHLQKHLGSVALTDDSVEMTLVTLMVDDIIDKMRRQLAVGDAGKRGVPRFRNLTPFLFVANDDTLASAVIDKRISKGLRHVVSDNSLHGLLLNPWTNELQVSVYAKQAAASQKRPLDGFATNDERDADRFDAEATGAVDGATSELVQAVLDELVPPAKRRNCTVLLPDEFAALKRARFLVLHGGAQALGVDPNVGTLVFATPGGGPYEKINSFTAKLKLLDAKRAGSVMQRQAAQQRQRRVADEMARRLAAALLVAPDDNSPPADVVVYVGNAFKNKTMKNAHTYAAGELLFAALRRLPRFRFTIVHVPEPFTTRVAVYDD